MSKQRVRHIWQKILSSLLNRPTNKKKCNFEILVLDLEQNRDKWNIFMENWRKNCGQPIRIQVSFSLLYISFFHEHHQISSCISCEPSLNWSLVLDKLIMEFTEITQLGSFSTVLTRLAELWFEAESVWKLTR